VHSEVDSCQVCWQDAQRFQKEGSGLRQRAQSGRLGVPPFSGAPVPQPEQMIQRLRHRSHTGAPVAREMPIRPPSASLQMLRGRPGPGRQVWQTGPASVTAATRRGFPHFAQGFQLRGSRCQQFRQTGCPPSLRRAGWRTFPHRPQSTARAFLNDGQITLALADGAQAAIIVASLAVGLVIARVVTDQGWTLV
jgi:hypothetical protein